MAKSKNHTAHNQSYKNHRNGIKKPMKQRNTSTKGVSQLFAAFGFNALLKRSGGPLFVHIGNTAILELLNSISINFDSLWDVLGLRTCGPSVCSRTASLANLLLFVRLVPFISPNCLCGGLFDSSFIHRNQVLMHVSLILVADGPQVREKSGMCCQLETVSSTCLVQLLMCSTWCILWLQLFLPSLWRQ